MARLQHAAARGLPLPIPGAREIREHHPPAEPMPSDRTAGAQLSTETRLEYERAGGGAAHQRHGVRHRGRLARFWRYLFRPSRSVHRLAARHHTTNTSALTRRSHDGHSERHSQTSGKRQGIRFHPGG